MTQSETLATLHQAGGQLQARPGGELLVAGVEADRLHPATVASLKRHKKMLWRYVSAFPGGCWPDWKGVPMKQTWL